MGNKKREFSMYDIEQFLREAGAERIHEKAVISLERELQDTVNEIVEQASVYANYAGRKKLININDIRLANRGKLGKRHMQYRHKAKRRINVKPGRIRFVPPKIMLVNGSPIVKQEQIIL